MNFRIVLKDENASPQDKPVQWFAVDQKSAVDGAKKNLEGKPKGTYAKIYRRVDEFVQDVTQDGAE